MPLFHPKTRKNIHKQSGFAALLTIIIVSAATLFIALNAALLGLGELDLGYTAQKGGETFSLAEGCVEEALHRLRLNTGYSGGSLSQGTGSCTITVSGGALSKTISIVANIETTFYTYVDVDITLSGNTYPTITITDWDEVSG